MKENREFDMLENADDKTLELLSEVPVLTKEEKERLLAMSKKKLDKMNRESNININNDGYEVSGVERYHRPKWHAVASVAACMLLVCGIGGTVFTLNKNRNAIKTPFSDSDTVSTVGSTSPAEDTKIIAGKLIGSFYDASELMEGLPMSIELDNDDTQTVEGNDGSPVVYTRVASKWSTADELNHYLTDTFSGIVLDDFSAAFFDYTGREPAFREIDGKLYFRKEHDYTEPADEERNVIGKAAIEVENYDGTSFDISLTTDYYDTVVMPDTPCYGHAVLEGGKWKLDSFRTDVASSQLRAEQDPDKFDKEDAMDLLMSFENADRMLAGDIKLRTDRGDIKYLDLSSPSDGKGTAVYYRVIMSGILDMDMMKNEVTSAVTEPALSKSYAFIYDDEAFEAPMFKEFDGKLYCRDYARGNRYNLSGNPEVISNEDGTYTIIALNSIPGGTEKVKFTAVYEDKCWKISDFGYPDDEQPTAADSDAPGIAKEAPNMLNDVMKVMNGTVITDEIDHLDNDTIYKYCGMTNPNNIAYYKVDDPRFSTLDDIKSFISERTVGSYREDLINAITAHSDSDGFPVYIENVENGKLYSRISRFGGLNFTGDVEVMNSTETTMTVRAKVDDPTDSYMLIFLELDDGKWKISTFKYM
ncbi:MAG: hypothetical protein IKW96_13255 [Ruminococcus sp.]|uniref:hypothetical protein n=1 Tax=Ruminococcus sp. TaxID=41978 RepID=UPI0025F1BCFC|nr:hypothetical protein [Ruminococcus sp.]MBR5684215.1 hypothetical protein [Ruminococcus sp.]